MITNFTKSNEYRNEVHNFIPGGAHTYSKGDDQFPLLSPAAIERGKGSHIWDLDGNEYVDCAMGLTSICLGHAYEPVLYAIRKQLELGVNFQRPASIELEYAKEFVSLIPGAEMVKFAKNGSTVTTAAVKLARVYTKRDLAAFPYDHPFYSYDDWFIGKTACNLGVPKAIQDLSVTFKSDDIDSLKEMFAKYPNQIACVLTEPEKWAKLPENFLADAKELCHKNGAVFILDEMITGFKTDLPGSQTKYGVEPDLSTWGKGIANGFSFCALTGKKEIMNLGGIKRIGEPKVFLVSTTHGAETQAIAAAQATLKEFREKNVIAYNQSIGDKFAKGLIKITDEMGLNDYIETYDVNWFPLSVFKGQDKKVSMPYRTLFLQEMIKRGVLYQGSFIPCFSHTDEDLEHIFNAFGESCEVYKKALKDGFEKYLVGEPTKPVFREFN